MKKLILIISIFLITSISYAQPIERVQIEPLSGGISFNTVEFEAHGTNWGSWITAPTVEMVGRKEILIKNVSSDTIVYLTGVSGSTVKGTLEHGEVAKFKVSSTLHIYVSANTVSQVEVWEIR